MIALVRYTWSDAFRSQRWVAPLLCFLVVEAIVDATTGSVLPTYAISAAVLLFVATWLTITICNSEDSLQYDVTVVTAGGHAKVRIAKLLTSYLAAITLGAIALIGPPLASPGSVDPGAVVAGIVANLLTAAAGVALGALCSRPLVRRTAWAVLIAVVIDLTDIVVPSGIPTRQLLVLFDKAQPRHLALTLALIALETAILVSLAVTASVRWTRVRA